MRCFNRRFWLVMAATAMLLFVHVPPATAAGNWNLLDTSSRGGQGGSGGNFQYITKYKFNYSNVKVEDYCPPDDWGVGIFFSVETRPFAYFDTTLRGYNDDGCDTVITAPNGKVSSTKKIYSMTVVLYFMNNGSFVEYGTQSNVKENPFCC